MDKYQNWTEALSAFDTSAQIHGWAADMGTEKQALQARRDYERDKAIVCAAVLAVVAERDALREALQSIVDCCDEDHAARDYSSRQTEIRGIARYALAQGES